MIPIARTEQLLIQEVGNELIIYDQVNHSSHCLNAIAARVWELSNGRNTIDDIARVLEKEFGKAFDADVDLRGLVWLTLEELEQYSLIQEYVKQPKEVFGLPRRTVLKTAVLAGGFAVGTMFPAVKSIAVSDPGGARSTGNPPPPNNNLDDYDICENSGGEIFCTHLPVLASCESRAENPCDGDCMCKRFLDETGIPFCKCVKPKKK